MKIIVACEESQVITKQFRAKGHEAYSCDLKPCSGGKPDWHIRGDIFDYIYDWEWDLMIAHPPCTFLTTSNTYLKRGCNLYTAKEAAVLQRKAVRFFMKIANAPIPRIVIENPVGIMSSIYRKPDQIIHPWQFGDPESKSTCLWLKNMPRLNPNGFASLKFYRCHCGKRFSASKGKYGCKCKSTIAAKPMWENQTISGQNNLMPSKERASLRSTTYFGIAKEMANQWDVLPELLTIKNLFE